MVEGLQLNGNVYRPGSTCWLDMMSELVLTHSTQVKVLFQQWAVLDVEIQMGGI